MPRPPKLPEARVLIIVNLIHPCLKCGKCSPSVGHDNLSSLRIQAFSLFLEGFLQSHLYTPAPPASDTEHLGMDGCSLRGTAGDITREAVTTQAQGRSQSQPSSCCDGQMLVCGSSIPGAV